MTEERRHGWLSLAVAASFRVVSGISLDRHSDCPGDQSPHGA
jgi:hypothetical protein